MNMIEKVLYLGLGVFSVTRERMEKVVNELIEKGELSREEAGQVMDELIKRGEEEKTASKGPLQITGSSSLGRKKLMDIILIPNLVIGGIIPYSLAFNSTFFSPKTLGWLGPVMSASNIPTLLPCLARVEAIRPVTEDFPTPPFPLMTTKTFSILLSDPSKAFSGSTPHFPGSVVHPFALGHVLH
jgi:hypothetical protein